MRKFLAATAATVAFGAMSILPAVAGNTTVVINNAAGSGTLSITTIPAGLTTSAGTATHTFDLGQTVAKDLRATTASFQVQMSHGAVTAALGGSTGSIAFGACYDEVNDVVAPLGASAAAAAGAACGTGYAALSGTATTIATVTNEAVSKLGTVTYNPKIQVTGLNTAANDIFSVTFTQSLL